MTKYIRILLILLVVTAILLLIIYKAPLRSPAKDNRSDKPLFIENTKVATSNTDSKLSKAMLSRKQSANLPLASIYNSEDLYYLASSILDSARKGNSTNQFLLHEILETCNIKQREYRQSIISGLPSELREIVSDLESKCSGFTPSSIQSFAHENENHWLFVAFSQGNPLAQVELLARIKKLELYKLDNKEKVNNRDVVRNILESGNLDAIRRLDWISKNSLPNAWAFASCALGASCKPQSYNEKVAFFHYCRAQEALGIKCSHKDSYRTIFVDRLAPEKKSAFLKEVQTIQEKIEKGDTSFLIEKFDLTN